MREILFRGKRMDNGEWLYGFPVTDQGIKCGTPNCICKHDGSAVYVMYFWDYDSHEFDEFDVNPETVGQYTGLKDSTGKRIFEGDIVHYKNSIEQARGIIEWGGCRFYFKWIDITEPNGSLYFFQCEKELEIVGNIHDNPELLEVGE